MDNRGYESLDDLKGLVSCHYSIKILNPTALLHNPDSLRILSMVHETQYSPLLPPDFPSRVVPDSHKGYYYPRKHLRYYFCLPCFFPYVISPRPWNKLAKYLQDSPHDCSNDWDDIECIPVAFYWNKSINGKCLHQLALVYAGTGSSIIFHIVILVLPIPCISSLKVGRGKRIGLFIMFGLGTL